MLRKPFHGWRIKQEIQKLTVIRAPAPRLNPVPEWAGSASRPTPTPRTSLSPLPLLFFCHNLPPTFPPFSLATQLPSTVAHYSSAPKRNQMRHRCQVVNMSEEQEQEQEQEQAYYGCYGCYRYQKEQENSPLRQRWKNRSPEEINKICRAVSWEMKYGEEALDHFYRQMSKEVETILHERDPVVPEELSRRVVVTCVSEDCSHNWTNRDNWTYTYVLRRRNQGSGASAAKSTAKESSRELEVELVMTYSPQVKMADAYWPSHHFPFGKGGIPRKLKVVNKFELWSQDEGVFFVVANEEARKYGDWLIAQNKLAGKDTGKDTGDEQCNSGKSPS